MRKTNSYEIYGIKVAEFSLPPATEQMSVIKFYRVGGTVGIVVKIKDKEFKRLQDGRLPVVWMDGDELFSTIINDNKKAADLEAIFKNYCEEVKFNQIGHKDKLLN
jgi:hypothetical protein